MPGTTAPSQNTASHHLGKCKPPLEGGEEKHIQAMDINANEGSHKSQQEPIDFQQLHEQWFVKYADIFNRVPLELLLLREINHQIPLIDDGKQYYYHLPCCPDAMKLQLMEKLWQYVGAGWWIPKAVPQAAPLLCIPKKLGKLRTVVDYCQCNDNTVKDVTPFLDQDQIRMDIVQVKFCSKIDLSNVYKQVCIKLEDVHKTSFTMVFRMHESNVMQQGNCNVPSTFQWLMTIIFHDAIGIFIHVYLDDLFIFSSTLEEHNKHLEYVLQKLHENCLFIKKAKCDLYLKSMDCLSHIIDDQGLHADADKVAHIHEWHIPKNHKDIQHFLGLVQYLAHFMPDITAYTGPLSTICRNGQPFYWKLLYETCFNHIKVITCKSPVLKPIDPQSRKLIWVICDASMSGIGAIYSQGETWQTCHPASFMSKKFTVV
jgi:hypothetical protein